MPGGLGTPALISYSEPEPAWVPALREVSAFRCRFDSTVRLREHVGWLDGSDLPGQILSMPSPRTGATRSSRRLRSPVASTAWWEGRASTYR